VFTLEFWNPFLTQNTQTNSQLDAAKGTRSKKLAANIKGHSWVFALPDLYGARRIWLYLPQPLVKGASDINISPSVKK